MSCENYSTEVTIDYTGIAVKAGDSLSFYRSASFSNNPIKVIFAIEKVIFNDPATIVIWEDGTKTVVKVQNGEPFDKEKGFAMALVKFMSGNTGAYNKLFAKWIED